MSQTWTHIPLLSTDTLADSRTYINDALDALKTSWSGTSEPTSPVRGQWFIDSDDNTLKIHNGTSWCTIGDADVTYLGLLPRSAGSSYALSGALYCGSQQVKQVATPTDGTDATNKAYTDAKAIAGGTFTGAITMGAYKVTSTRTVPDDDSEFVRKDYVDAKMPKTGGTFTGDVAMNGTEYITGLPSESSSTPADYAATCGYVRSHVHNGTEAVKVVLANIDIGTPTNGTLAMGGSSALSMVMPWAAASTSSVSVGTSYADVLSATVTLPRTTTQIYLTFRLHCDSGGDYGLRLQDGADTTIVEWYQSAAPNYHDWVASGQDQNPVFTWLWTPGTTGSYTATIQLRGSGTEYYASLFLVMIG